tara:strand:+ start:2317 stop:2496 length:180 start_codon:yes stop_codon:yes gene_type:complete
MEEDENIKKEIVKEKNYESYDIAELKNEIILLKKQLNYLEKLLKEKKLSQNKAGEIFKK